MLSSLVNPCKPFPSIAFIAVLTLLSSGWSCSAMFESCQGVSQAQINSLSPSNIPSDANSVPLMVEGSGFRPVVLKWNVLEAPEIRGAQWKYKRSITGDEMDGSEIIVGRLPATT